MSRAERARDPEPGDVLPPATMRSMLRHYMALLRSMSPNEAYEHAVVCAYNALSRARRRENVIVDMDEARRRLRG